MAISHTERSKWLAGIDISGHQDLDEVDFNKLSHASPQVRFAYVKATEGVSYVNPDAQWQVGGFLGPEVPLPVRTAPVVGPYTFARFAQSPIEGARHFYNTSKRLWAGRPMLMPMLDAEWRKGDNAHNAVTGKKMIEWLTAFFGEAESLFGREVGIYTGPYWWADKVSKEVHSLVKPLWLARHTKSPDKLPLGFTDWLFWQFTGKGTVSGIDDALDRNWFGGTEDELLKLSK